VRPSPRPETWNIGPLVVLAVILGGIMLIEALGLLAFGWHRFGLADDGGRTQTFTFQTLLFFALFSIVSIRERRAFWSSRPSVPLAGALLADGLVGVLIGVFGLADLPPLPLRDTAAIVSVAALCSLGLNDFVKTSFLGFLYRREARWA
jgi:hypothetical protein